MYALFYFLAYCIQAIFCITHTAIFSNSRREIQAAGDDF